MAFLSKFSFTNIALIYRHILYIFIQEIIFIILNDFLIKQCLIYIILTNLTNYKNELNELLTN